MICNFVTAKEKKTGEARQGWVVGVTPLKIVGQSGKLYNCEGYPTFIINSPEKSKKYIDYLEKTLLTINSTVLLAEEWSADQKNGIPESKICMAALKDIRRHLNT